MPKVVLKALRGDITVTKLAKRHDLPPKRINGLEEGGGGQCRRSQEHEKRTLTSD